MESDDGRQGNSMAEDSTEIQYEPPRKKTNLDSSSDHGVLTTRMITCSRSGRGGKNGVRGDKNGGRGGKNGGRDNKMVKAMIGFVT